MLLEEDEALGVWYIALHGHLGSQAWAKCDVAWLYAKREVKLISNTSMRQTITDIN